MNESPPPVPPAPLVPLAKPSGNPFSRKLLLRAGIGVAVLIVSVVAILLSQKDPPVRSSSIGARLELAAGEVTLKDGNQTPTVISGVALPSGAELATGKGARAL